MLVHKVSQASASRAPHDSEKSFSSADNTGLRFPRLLKSPKPSLLFLLSFSSLKKFAIFVELKVGIFKFSLFTRLPGSHSFQEVYNATLTRLLAPGNVSSCVDDAGTSKIPGQVVTASLKIYVAMIIPACEFFDDLRRAPNVSLTPQPTSRRVSRSRKFKGTADWCETEPLCCTFPFLINRMGWCGHVRGIGLF